MLMDMLVEKAISKSYVYLPEREPKHEDYEDIDVIEVVHFPIYGKNYNAREALVRKRIQTLQEEGGIKIREVDIETDPGNINSAVIAGAESDVCAALRRQYDREHGVKVVLIDIALTADP
jgi:hypothetical protein